MTLICQREFGLVKAPLPLKTVGFNTCVITTFFNRNAKIAGLAHFDRQTDIARSFARVIIPAFSGLEGQTLVKLILCQQTRGKELPKEIEVQINNTSQFRFQDTLLFPTYQSGLEMESINGGTKKLSETIGETPEELKRLSDSLLYIASGKKMIRNVTSTLELPPDHPAPPSSH